MFDFDGTLADSASVAVALYNRVAQPRGWGLLTPENLEELRGLSMQGRFVRLGIPPRAVPALVVRLIRLYRAEAARVPLHPGVPELLRDLRARGYRLFVVSTNAEETIRAVLARHGLEQAVEEVRTSGRLFGKGRLLSGLLRRHHLLPQRSVYVGDELRDLEASRQAGLRFVAVSWGVDTASGLQRAGPDALVHHPAEITRWLESWA
ncbi:HAD family hydrolase [Deinobacterium chartae]|uniref:HAD family hydrolase n=1 Tax=Deinobacterium chartae TaxID=521158 RepID=UPI0031B5D6EE